MNNMAVIPAANLMSIQTFFTNVFEMSGECDFSDPRVETWRAASLQTTVFYPSGSYKNVVFCSFAGKNTRERRPHNKIFELCKFFASQKFGMSHP